ncbi:Uncharacterised protein [Providencia rettgeri]|uniref:Uncharacterized protein n=1 Tax=Providencia rettgeri TaxID=587 RepID=A0A379FPC5_PRORE|nr:Uncharacterised protein [Providencia rettgeri]
MMYYSAENMALTQMAITEPIMTITLKLHA